MDPSSRIFSGAHVRRVVDHSHRRVGEHAHDWPVLSLFVLGGYRNHTELGEVMIEGPSAVLYRGGAAHRNRIGPAGFEQVEIEFDPDWLGRSALPDTPVSLWLGGWAGGRARGLARDCLAAPSAEVLKGGLWDFIQGAARAPAVVRPEWMRQVERRLRAAPGLSVRDLATEVGRHPVWLGAAYRRVAGEAPSEAAARFRVEAAARLLRETDETPARIAVEAGFCDQSHMIRTFRRLMGRLPSAVRADAARLRPGA
jgi:AraC family transcriptional regulator